MLKRALLFSLLSVCAIAARAERIDYEIFTVDESGSLALIAKGIKEYGDVDIDIEERNFRGESHWSKSLALEGDFSVGASIYREPAITGFGLWVKRSPCGFSWEWFDAMSPGRFEKLQETGQVSVAYRDVGQMKEISEITFDTDVSLRLNESQDIHRKTHRILVKKGSVLKFPSNNSLHRTRAGGTALACAGR